MAATRAGFCLAVIVTIATLAFSPPSLANRPKIGEIAPDFELTLIDGQQVRLADLRGKVVVLNFWATWCAPCKKELPLLDTYYKINQKHGLEVFAVATEDSLPNYRLKSLFAALTMRSAKQIKGPYKALKAVPTNYVIDRSGRIRLMKAGACRLEDLNSILVPLLNEPAPTS